MDVTHVARRWSIWPGLPLESNVPFSSVMATKMPLFQRIDRQSGRRKMLMIFLHSADDLFKAIISTSSRKGKMRACFLGQISALGYGVAPCSSTAVMDVPEEPWRPSANMSAREEHSRPLVCCPFLDSLQKSLL